MALMIKRNLKHLPLGGGIGIGILGATLLLASCFDSSGSKTVDSGIYFPIDGVNYSAVSVASTAVTLPAGARLLASQCAQCHGTFGVAVREWPDLWGSGRQISTWMNNYQDAATYSDNMMYMHAMAYTTAEVDLLKSYYPKISYDPNL
jgi:cytochrome c553